MNPTITSDLAILYALTAHTRLWPKPVGALLTHFGSPEAVVEADVADVATIAGMDERACERWELARASLEFVTEELEFIVAHGTDVIGMHESRYPARLSRLTDPPPLLYVHGELPDDNLTAVAVVGSHHADNDGIADAVAWGKGFAARDVIVISGLALGVDGGAHTGALVGEGRTVAVLGSGFENIYPSEHRGLAEQIAIQGALITEYPPSTPLSKMRLIRRNRLIVALADAVVVVRLHDDSRGSMEAIARAADIATPVFLVASDTSTASQKAVSNGAVPIAGDPDFDLVLNYLC